MKFVLMSDIHSNFVALEAVLKDMGEERFDRICMLGDIIAFGPQAKRCLDTVRSWQGAWCLKGNHDDNVVRQGLPLGVSEDLRKYEALDRNGLGLAALKWLGNLPAMRREGEMLFVHASPREPLREYVDSPEACDAALESSDARLTFCGHSHRPLWYSRGRLQRPEGRLTRYVLDPGSRHVINVGSVGESRDRDPRACYAVYDDATHALEFRRVSYDVMSMVEDMRRQGYPEALWRKRVVP
ncbi:MAG: metallophosphoesterase family protein [candidate division FCPU426 bacterium]